MSKADSPPRSALTASAVSANGPTALAFASGSDTVAPVDPGLTVSSRPKRSPPPTPNEAKGLALSRANLSSRLQGLSALGLSAASALALQYLLDKLDETRALQSDQLFADGLVRLASSQQQQLSGLGNAGAELNSLCRDEQLQGDLMPWLRLVNIFTSGATESSIRKSAALAWTALRELDGPRQAATSEPGVSPRSKKLSGLFEDRRSKTSKVPTSPSAVADAPPTALSAAPDTEAELATSRKGKAKRSATLRLTLPAQQSPGGTSPDKSPRANGIGSPSSSDVNALSPASPRDSASGKSPRSGKKAASGMDDPSEAKAGKSKGSKAERALRRLSQPTLLRSWKEEKEAAKEVKEYLKSFDANAKDIAWADWEDWASSTEQERSEPKRPLVERPYVRADRPKKEASVTATTSPRSRADSALEPGGSIAENEITMSPSQPIAAPDRESTGQSTSFNRDLMAAFEQFSESLKTPGANDHPGAFLKELGGWIVGDQRAAQAAGDMDRVHENSAAWDLIRTLLPTQGHWDEVSPLAMRLQLDDASPAQRQAVLSLFNRLPTDFFRDRGFCRSHLMLIGTLAAVSGTYLG